MPIYVSGDTTVGINVNLQDGLVTESVSSLKINVGAFKYDIGGNRGAFAGAVDFPVDDDTTNYIYLDNAGTLQKASTFPTNIAYISLAKVIASAGQIIAIQRERVLLGASSAVQGTCRIGFSTDAGVHVGNSDVALNNGIAAVTFSGTGVSRNGWNFKPPKNYISGDLTLRLLCTFADTPGATTMRVGVKWSNITAGTILPSSYQHEIDQTCYLTAVTADVPFVVDFTLPFNNFDTNADMTALYLMRDGDHVEDTTALTLYTHFCELRYTGYMLAGQAGQ